jgi:hypothetical protein
MFLHPFNSGETERSIGLYILFYFVLPQYNHSIDVETFCKYVCACLFIF